MNTKLTSFVKTLAMAVCIVGLVTGCEEKNGVTDEPNVEPGVPAYMSVSVQLPTAGSAQYAPGMEQRAPYQDENTEVGSDAENTVKEVLLVLADKNNNYCLHAVASNNTASANLNVTAEFNQTGISMFYDEASGKLKEAYKNGINVFVFCNPTEHLKTEMGNAKNAADKKAWTDLACTKEHFGSDNTGRNASIWASRSFLMSNYSIAVRDLPGSLADWSQYNSASRAFNLSTDNGGAVNNSSTNDRGAIKVERSVARLDFKDGSGSSNTYAISEADGSNLMKVQLVRMGLVNMSNKFYYLRHMAANNNGAAATDITLLDEESKTNYVMDVDASDKRNDIGGDYNKLHGMFEYPLFSDYGTIDDRTRSQWDNWFISDVLNSENMDKGGEYHVWRYITENTVPAVAQQKAAYSTGVVFKGKLLAGDNLNNPEDDLLKAINGTYDKSGDYVYQVAETSYPILFLFQNQLYVGFENGVKKSDEYKGESSAIWRAVNEKLTIEGETEAHSPAEYYEELMTAVGAKLGVDDALAKFRKAATAAGFTLYQASTGDKDGSGYYFYYYYWIRHRNNSDNNTMGPMEFATVRNNVYKLSVTKISKIGYPRIQDNNPDPVDPEDPDETSERYITVEVEVLPWVVRKNDIEF